MPGEGLPGAVRAFLAKQPRCRGVLRLRRPDEVIREPEWSPCEAEPREKYATHHQPYAETPDVCDDCAAWLNGNPGKYNMVAHPRRDREELLRLIALAGTEEETS